MKLAAVPGPPGTIRGSGDLFEPVVVVKSAEYGDGSDACVVWQSMPVLAELDGQSFRWLGNAGAERHVRAFVVVKVLPAPQDSPEMVFRERDEEVEAFSSIGADEALTKSIGLGRFRRSSEDSEAEILDGGAEAFRIDAVPVDNEKAVGMFTRDGFAELLQRPLRSRMVGDVGV